MPQFLPAEINISPPLTSGWQTVDLSSYLPAEADAVILHGYHPSADTAWWVGARRYGYSGDIRGYLRGHTWLFTKVSSDKKIDVYKSSSSASYSLVGWFTASDGYFVDPVSLGVGQSGWETVDVSSYVQGSDVLSGVLLFVRNSTSTTYSFGLRKKGSSDNRTATGESSGGCVGVNSSNQFEAYLGSTSQSVYLIGYLKDNVATLNDNGSDVSPTAGSWQDAQLALAGKLGAILEVSNATGTATTIGARRKGDTLAITRQPSGNHSWAIIGVDANGYGQLYRSGSYALFHLLGVINVPYQAFSYEGDISANFTLESNYELVFSQQTYLYDGLVDLAFGIESSEAVTKAAMGDLAFAFLLESGLSRSWAVSADLELRFIIEGEYALPACYSGDISIVLTLETEEGAATSQDQERRYVASGISLMTSLDSRCLFWENPGPWNYIPSPSREKVWRCLSEN